MIHCVQVTHSKLYNTKNIDIELSFHFPLFSPSVIWLKYQSSAIWMQTNISSAVGASWKLITRERFAPSPSVGQGTNLVNNATIYWSYWSFGSSVEEEIHQNPFNLQPYEALLPLSTNVWCLISNIRLISDRWWRKTHTAQWLVGHWSSTCLPRAGRLFPPIWRYWNTSLSTLKLED